VNRHYKFYSSVNQGIIDALMAGAAFYLAYQIRFEWQVPPANAYQMWLFLIPTMLGQVLISSLMGTYRLVWRYISLADASLVARSHSVFSALLFTAFFATPRLWALWRIPRSIIVIQFLLSLVTALGVRASRRVLYERLNGKKRNGVRAPRVVLVGAGDAGVMVAKELASRSDFRPVGFLDDDPEKIGMDIQGLRVLGPLSALPAIASGHGLEEVVICIPRIPRSVLRRLWAQCEALTVQIKIVPTLEEILHGNVNIAAFREVQMTDLLGRESIELAANDTELAAAYRSKRILITGAGGSIGAELACQFSRLQPAALILLDKDENSLHDACLRVKEGCTGSEVYAVVADMRFPARLRSVFSEFHPEVVFHAAAHKHVHLMEINPCEAILNNVTGTRNLVEFSANFGVSRFVLISTDKAVRPASIMGASKRVGEMIVQAQQGEGSTRFSCVRFGNVLGSHGSVIPLFQKQIASGKPLTITDAEAQRFLMTIPEAVSLLIQAGTLGTAGETFVLDMGSPVLIGKLARDLIELSGLRPDKDVPIEIMGLRRGEKISEQLFDEDTEELRPTRFEKIKVIPPRELDVFAFAQKLSALERAASRQSVEDVYRILRELHIGFQAEEMAAVSRAAAQPLRKAASAAAFE